MTTKTLQVTTQSFVIEMSEDMIIQNIQCTNDEVSKLLEEDTNNHQATKLLLGELAMNLFISKEVAEEVISESTRNSELANELEDRIHVLTTENEMLRDELDEER